MNKTGNRCFLNTRSKFNTEEDSASEASTGSLELKKMAVLEKDCHFRLKRYLL